MSRADQTPRTRSTHDTSEATRIAVFLRGLAARVERDPAFARQIGEALDESGLLSREQKRSSVPTASSASTGERPADHAGEERAAHDSHARLADPLPDPFVALRAGGEPALRASLDGLDLAALRRLVRAYHLDPNRVSARWSVREPVITLIVNQVRARANHGRSFERV